ncbi:hypothetical protein CANARDRAFT_30384 [[Candida] arabinofermentans NRRL YB-2248]|uniref:DNA-directed RNA polymerase n=1 Tax=[Candida] arabinofermentans NRRL YB-2248 TaxID=983967 RepID=A0A1E4SU49_9ASCO|nr:hypothetical protein CANARDRAFT_30384 [[Candida] arabinofermentans NRRL YB-2248]
MLRLSAGKKLLVTRNITLSQQVAFSKVLQRNASFFTKEAEPKTETIDQIYDKLNTKTASKSRDAMYLSTSSDNVVTTVSSTALQNWTLFEACLNSKDYERADMMLHTMAQFKDPTNNKKLAPYFADGICEFLKFWGSQESVSMESIRNWLDYVSQFSRDFKSDPRVASWLIRLAFSKGLPVQEIIKEFYYYTSAAYHNRRSDILKYMDIIGILNVRKLINYEPDLLGEVPVEYKELFEFLGKGDLEESLAELHQNEEMQTKSETVQPLKEAVSNESSEQINDELLDNEPKTINRGLDDLLPVSSHNLITIRHSLMGLLNSFNDGQFFRNLIEMSKEQRLDLDYESLEKQIQESQTADLFELKKSLPYHQHDQFDSILDEISKDRQLVLESTMTEASRKKWEYEYQNLKDKSIPSSIGSYLHLWMTQTVPLIEAEIKEYQNARDHLKASDSSSSSSSNTMRITNKKISSHTRQRYQEKLKYGPFLLLLAPEKLASITILELIKIAATLDITHGISVSKLVMAIGKAVELEHKSERILSSEIDVNKQFKAIRKSYRFLQFVRGTKSSELIKKAEFGKDFHNSTSKVHSESSMQAWDTDSRCRLGSVLLSLLLQVAKVDVEGKDPTTGDIKKAMAPAFYHTYDQQNGGKVGVVKINQKFASKLGSDRLDQSIHTQFLPMISKPVPWTSYNNGGYHLTKRNVMKTRNAPEQMSYVKAAANSNKLDTVFQALNNLGYTSWTINRKVMKTMIEVWNRGEAFLEIPKVTESLVLPDPPKKGSSVQEFMQHRENCREIANAFAKDRSMRCDMNYKLEIARAFAGERIFFPHSLDFRGRAYPVPPHFNHLGNDLSRGLLVFWKGKELGEEGLRWLKIHCCNLYGLDKITLDERVQFVEDNIEQILDSARNPLDKENQSEKMWMKADKPWQFLACAIELNEALKLDDPTKFISHQPVHQDGTCNGLQHYAALGGDILGAKQVNLVPADKPSDVYSHVAKLVGESVDLDVEEGIPEAIATKQIISRKLVKQTVMTSVYGVTFVGARAQVSRRLKEIDFDKDQTKDCSKYLTIKVFKAIRELFDGAHAIQDWFDIVAKRISKSIRLDVDITQEPEFMSSVIWTAPSGLPVVQPYRESKQRLIQTNLQTITIVDPYEVKNVDVRKQANGFPPNFIHSLDATHMIFSVNQCCEHGLTFASVHDSYWTHASDVPEMNMILREQFISLHTTNLVQKLKSEFEQRYAGFLMVVNVQTNSDVGRAVQAFRKKLSARLGRPCNLGDELNLEKERRRLLQADNFREVALGKKLETSITVLESVGYTHDTIIDNDGAMKILVPLVLPPIPPRGEFDVSVVRDSQYFFS